MLINEYEWGGVKIMCYPILSKVALRSKIAEEPVFTPAFKTAKCAVKTIHFNGIREMSGFDYKAK